MQITSIPLTPADIEPGIASSTAVPLGTAVDFATVLAALLDNGTAGKATPTLVGIAPDGTVDDTESDEAVEDAAPDVDGTAKGSDATPLSNTVLAAAMAAATPPPPTPVLPQTKVEVEPPSPTSTVGGATPSLVSLPPSASTEPHQDQPQIWVPVEVALDAAGEETVPPLRSTASYSVQPSPARAAAEAITSQVAPATSGKVTAKPSAAPELPVKPAQAPMARVGTTAEVPVLESEAQTAAPVPPVLVQATGNVVAPAPATVLANAVIATDTADTAPDTGQHGDSRSQHSSKGELAKLEAAAPLTPVLERNAVVLARNALNEQVRGASARELLTSAREADVPADRKVERPVEVPGGHLLVSSAEQLQRTATKAATPADVPAPLHATLSTLGEDLVKHVGVHATPGERTLTLKLTPESLGEVQVEIRSTRSELSVRLVSQDDGVRQALEQHAVGLRENLARDGRETRVEIGSQLTSNFGQTHDGSQLGRQPTQHDAQDRPRVAPATPYGTAGPETKAPPTERRGNPHVGVLNLFA